MGHDIYSLGVCFLEIGLWQSYAVYNASGIVEAPGQVLGLTLDEIRRMRPKALKERLVALATRRISQAMGGIYTEVVIECLTCLDNKDDDEEESDDDKDADSALVGVQYIEKVCRAFRQLGDG